MLKPNCERLLSRFFIHETAHVRQCQNNILHVKASAILVVSYIRAIIGGGLQTRVRCDN